MMMNPELRGYLHRPEKIIGRMWQGGRFVNPHQGGSDQPKVLREASEYKDFLFHFAKFGTQKDKYKNFCGSEPLSEICYTNAEAFIVCVYTFNYKEWHQKFKKEAVRVEGAECVDCGDGGEDEEEECQETEGLQRKRQRTADYGGWSEDAFNLYYEVGELIRNQRNTEQSKALEGELMERWRRGGSFGTGTNRGQELSALEIREARQRERMMKEESMKFLKELGTSEQHFTTTGGVGTPV
jgi:hypothetical protein